MSRWGIARYALLAVVLAGAFWGTWRFVKPAYAPAFRWVGDAAFAQVGDPRLVEVRRFEGRKLYDTLLVLHHPDDRRRTRVIRVNSYYCGYKPTALLLALLLATPMTWRRRALLLPAGLLAAQAFVLMRLALVTAVTASAFEVRGARALELAWLPPPAIDALNLLLWDDLTSSFLIPIVLWMLLAVRWRKPVLAPPPERSGPPEEIPAEEVPAGEITAGDGHGGGAL